MNKKQLVLARLKSKPNVKSLGFDKKELMGVAAQIADNLTSEEDASEDEINAEIDKAIDAVVPFLQMAQSQANRVIETFKKNQKPVEDEEDDVDDDVEKADKSQNQKKQNQPKKTETSGEMEVIMKMFNELKNEFSTFKQGKVTDMRKQRLEALLKDTGTFGTRTLKSFGKMSFETDEEFDEFYTEVENDLKEYNKERATAGLSSLGSLPGVPPKKVKDEPFSDEEIAALAED